MYEMTWLEIIALTEWLEQSKLTKNEVDDWPISMNLRSRMVAKVASVSLGS